MVRFCGYINRFGLNGVDRLNPSKFANKQKMIVVTPGGGEDGFPLIRNYLDGLNKASRYNVIAEAMASGVAVVSTNISGIPELVDSGVDGLLVEEKDSAALATALSKLFDDPVLRERLAQNARTKTCRVFDSKRTTLDLKQLFDQCITGLRPVVAH